MANLLTQTFEKLNLPLSNSFFNTAVGGFFSSIISFSACKYVVSYYNKDLVTSPSIAVISSIPTILMGLLGNDHRLSGDVFGSSVALSFINPSYGLAAIPALAREIYCNNNECDKNTNIVVANMKKINLPVSNQYLWDSFISTLPAKFFLTLASYALGNKVTTFPLVISSLSISLEFLIEHKGDLSPILTSQGIVLGTIHPGFLGLTVAGVSLEIYCSKYKCLNSKEFVTQYISESNYSSIENLSKNIHIIRGFTSAMVGLAASKFIIPSYSYDIANYSPVIYGVILPALVMNGGLSIQEFINYNIGLSAATYFIDPKAGFYLASTLAVKAFCSYTDKCSNFNPNDIYKPFALSSDFVHDLIVSYHCTTFFSTAIVTLVHSSQRLFGAEPCNSYPLVLASSCLSVSTTTTIFGYKTLAVVSGGLLASAQYTQSPTIFSLFGLSIAGEMFYNVVQKTFLKSIFFNLASSGISLASVKYIALGNDEFSNHKALAIATSMIPGVIIAASCDDNHEMFGSLTGSCLALANIYPEFSTACIALAGIGEIMLCSSENNA